MQLLTISNCYLIQCVVDSCLRTCPLTNGVSLGYLSYLLDFSPTLHLFVTAHDVC
jgi:hypothetical protein